MAVVVVDASSWIDLAVDPSNAETLEDFDRAVSEGRMTLVTVDIARAAYERERERSASRYWDSRNGSLRAMRSLADLAPDKEPFVAQLDAIQNAIDRARADLPPHIARVDDLIAKGQLIKTDALLGKAAKRLQEQRAPAVRIDASSINDALIWEAVLEELDRREVIFVTDDNDFRDRGTLYPNLDEEAKAKPNRFCFHRLGDFAEKHLTARLVTVPSFQDIWTTPPDHCWICGRPASFAGIAPGLGGSWNTYIICPEHGRLDTGIPADD